MNISRNRPKWSKERNGGQRNKQWDGCTMRV